MTDLLKEFEQDLRRERTGELAARFGRVMVLASIAVVVATAVGVACQSHRKTVHMEETGRLMQAVQQLGARKLDDAKAGLAALANEASGSVRALALLRQAEAQRESGDEKAAHETYLALGRDAGAWGDLGRAAAAEGTPDKTSVFYYTQAENLAWKQLADGKKDEALSLMAKLAADPEAPSSERERLSQLLAHLAPDMQPQAAAAGEAGDAIP